MYCVSGGAAYDRHRQARKLPNRQFVGSVRKRWEMEDLLREYLPILIFIGIAVGIACAMLIASLVIASQKPDPEKLSPYECGFEPFEDARGRFDVRFYLVAILFIIFDLEVAFLFPWAVAFGDVGMFGFWPGCWQSL